MAKTAGRMEQDGQANRNQEGQRMAEMTPAQIGAYHADLALQDWATEKAEAARDGLQRADTPPSREYLTGQAERYEKWAATAIRQAERKL